MKVVIVEDEVLIGEDLTCILKNTSYNIEVISVLTSVTDAVAYFKANKQPDLIFCDIQLGDGHCFEIFTQVKMESPVVFCTAYDEHALEAFQNNGIAYVLKPFDKKNIINALERYKSLMATFNKNSIDYDSLLTTLIKKESDDKEVSSVLVNWKDKIIPVKICDIALFNIDYKNVQLITFNNKKYFITHTLDELETICGKKFYRANRQFLVNKESISEALQYSARKLFLKLKIEENHEIIISKNKVPEFLSWLKF